MKKYMSMSIRALILVGLLQPLALTSVYAQGSSNTAIDDLDEPKQEPAKTTVEKIQELQKRHEKAYSEISATLNKLPSEPELLGTKALFEHIDASEREMKKIRSGCASLISALRSETKAIKDSHSFTDEQKQELTESAEAHAKDCTVLSAKLDLAVQRLAAAYKVLPRWKIIYKSYHNLQGDEKAAEQVRAQVADYLSSFTPEPEKAADEKPPVENSVEKNSE